MYPIRRLLKPALPTVLEFIQNSNPNCCAGCAPLFSVRATAMCATAMCATATCTTATCATATFFQLKFLRHRTSGTAASAGQKMGCALARICATFS